MTMDSYIFITKRDLYKSLNIIGMKIPQTTNTTNPKDLDNAFENLNST